MLPGTEGRRLTRRWSQAARLWRRPGDAYPPTQGGHRPSNRSRHRSRNRSRTPNPPKHRASREASGAQSRRDGRTWPSASADGRRHPPPPSPEGTAERLCDDTALSSLRDLPFCAGIPWAEAHGQILPSLRDWAPLRLGRSRLGAMLGCVCRYAHPTIDHGASLAPSAAGYVAPSSRVLIPRARPRAPARGRDLRRSASSVP